MENEIWKPIIGFSDYEVSSLGNIKSVRSGKLLKQRLDRGYKKIGLVKNKKQVFFRVHRVVAKAFIDNYSELLEVDHIDRVRSNNKVSNLRCVSKKENLANRDYYINKNEFVINLLQNIKLESSLCSLDEVIKYLKNKNP